MEKKPLVGGVVGALLTVAAVAFASRSWGWSFALLLPGVPLLVGSLGATAKRNPVAAAGLSVVPGLGQFYNGQFGKGAAFLVAALVSLPLVYYVVGLVLIPILWVWSGLDAYRTADPGTHGAWAAART